MLSGRSSRAGTVDAGDVDAGRLVRLQLGLEPHGSSVEWHQLHEPVHCVSKVNLRRVTYVYSNHPLAHNIFQIDRVRPHNGAKLF